MQWNSYHLDADLVIQCTMICIDKAAPWPYGKREARSVDCPVTTQELQIGPMIRQNQQEVVWRWGTMNLQPLIHSYAEASIDSQSCLLRCDYWSCSRDPVEGLLSIHTEPPIGLC